MIEQNIDSKILKGYQINNSQSGNVERIVILLHGYGSNSEDLLSMVPEISSYLPNTLFISPNALYPCELSVGYQWFSLVDYDDERIAREVSIVSKEIAKFIEEQSEKYDVAYSNIAIVGFSQGTMVGLYTALRLEDAIAGVVGYSGKLVDPNALEREIKSKPSVLISSR